MLASQIVWLDSLITNVDRTARNTNMLTWYKELWLIDHGASLYFHHNWENWETQSQRPFLLIKDHVLLPWATEMEQADILFRSILVPEKIDAILALIPEEWLAGITPTSVEENRNVYRQFLKNRLSLNFINEAQHARKALI